MQKRGISQVVVTILLILLALVAVLIMWAVVGPYIKNIGGKIGGGTDCATINLEVTKAEWSLAGQKLTATVYRNSGAGTIENILVVSGGKSGSCTTAQPTELTTTSCTVLTLTSKPADVSIAAVVGTGSQATTCTPVTYSNVVQVA